MKMKSGSRAAVAGFALMLAGAAKAAEPANPALAGLEACVGLSDAAAKASCYDQALINLNAALRAGDIAIVQRKEAQAAQRSAFGLSLPALNLFDRMGPSAGPLEEVTGEVKRAERDVRGRWIIELTDGAVWRQVDDEAISPSPRVGSRAEIRRASLGNYFMKIDGRRGVRAKRSE